MSTSQRIQRATNCMKKQTDNVCNAVQCINAFYGCSSQTQSAFIFLASCAPFVSHKSTHVFTHTHVYAAMLFLCQQAHASHHKSSGSQSDRHAHTHTHTVDSRSEYINNTQQQPCAIKTESKTFGRKKMYVPHMSRAEEAQHEPSSATNNRPKYPQ